MAALVIPPVKRPAKHPRRQPIVLPPQLDKSCVLCLLPLRDNKWYDYSGKGNHGTIYGATWVSKGRRGAALLFDGVDDYTDHGNLPSLGQEFTVELWAYRLGSTGSYGTLLGIDADSWSTTGGFMIFDRNDGRIQGRVRNHADDSETAVLLETAVPDGVWRHYVVTWNRPLLIGYRNGVQVDSKTWDHDVGWDTYRLMVGKWFSHLFYGLIDEVRIYNRALTADEIRALYELGR